MEANLMARKRRLKSQLPDITSSLTLINKLRAKKDANEETSSQFLLSDSVYASAKIPPTDKVTFEFFKTFWAKSKRKLTRKYDNFETF